MGLREMPLAWQVATRVSKAQEICLLRIQVKDEATKGGSTPTAFAGSDGALGRRATAGSQASLNSSCP
jgi:hypothetical protein